MAIFRFYINTPIWRIFGVDMEVYSQSTPLKFWPVVAQATHYDLSFPKNSPLVAVPEHITVLNSLTLESLVIRPFFDGFERNVINLLMRDYQIVKSIGPRAPTWTRNHILINQNTATFQHLGGICEDARLLVGRYVVH